MSITYKKSGVDYSALDPIKKLAQTAAKKTGSNLKLVDFSEITNTRGESAYVWQQGNIYMAAVVEGLGTKNLIADEMRKINGKSYYDVMGNDTVASIINDLISVGAKPLVLHAYWAVGDSNWLSDKKRTGDLVRGWKKACDLSGVSWGGGETPTYKGIIDKSTIDLAGSAVGIIKNKKQLLTDKNLKIGDRIILIKSNGINMNGLTLARAIANKLTKRFVTKMPNGQMYGEAILKPANIYAKLIQDLFKAGVNIKYLSNITGHGLRKLMRARQNFTYVIEKLFPIPALFSFIQEKAGLSDSEMYQTFNMGQDFAIYLSARDVNQALKIIKKNKFVGINAGYLKKGPKQVIIESKNIVFDSKTLDLR